MSEKPVGQLVLLKILERSRWAPSGDNTQPWRFQILSNDTVVVHGHDTRDEILYDFDGHASHMAHGALLETMRIAASAEGLLLNWKAEADEQWRRVQYYVRFEPDSDLKPDPLHSFIESRMVQRRPMMMKALTEDQRKALIAAAGDACSVQLFEGFSEKRKVARLLWDNADIRLRCPEAFPVHKSIIEWGARFSEDRIPEEAVGVDPLTAKLMRWVMQSWGRVDFFNRYLLGTFAPRVQLDYIPALWCAAHILIRPRLAPSTLEEWVRLGQAMQNVWLTATKVGLHLQPEMTPVIFRWYARANRRFSADLEITSKADKLSREFELLVNANETDAFGFFGRVGVSKVPRSRSVRLKLEDLLQSS